jgi:CBS-domain-containing membrane protein
MDPDSDEAGGTAGLGGLDVTGAGPSSVLGRARERYGALGAGGYALLMCLVVLAMAGCVGLLLHQPWLFPSLGPTAMLFFESPEQDSARPLNTLVGHVVGILVGLGCLWLFGMSGAPPAPVGGLTPGYVAAGALSVAVTTFALTMLRRPHPPAGASTLIVSLGILTTASQLLSMVGAVALITVAGWGGNALLGTRPAGRAGQPGD